VKTGSEREFGNVHLWAARALILLLFPICLSALLVMVIIGEITILQNKVASIKIKAH